MKAVLQYRASPGFRRQIEALVPDWLDVSVIDEADKPAFAEAMQDADILLHVLEAVTAEVIQNATTLRLIQKIGVGVNTIDLEAAEQRDVAVCNMPGTNSRAVAEMTLTLMLAALRRVPYYDARMRAGDGWTADLDSFDGLGEVAGRTVGLVGYGGVARILAPILKAMGANVLYTATSQKAGADADWRDLPGLLKESDIVSLHLPLTPDTEKMIDAAAIAAMKPGAILVNTARGGLVDETALVQALTSGHLRAAGLDVVTVEPAPAGNPLFELDNVVIMPHIAWITPETLNRSLGIAFENCRRVRDGEDLLHRVV
ncbi:MAG: phosphoglycerate dehydrogenase-like enzyme [Paracoccaceae bacterium]|jgi:phosphoglycerate dehydrogenase-like enzyme